MDSTIDIHNLTYSHRPDSEPALHDINLNIPSGSRTLLIGANGAGKSTLLQILAGKRLVSTPGADIRIKGQDVFRNSPSGVAYLGTEWAQNPVVRGDIQVSVFLGCYFSSLLATADFYFPDSVGGYRYKERRDRLLDILDIDLEWRMHQISDGERRRVQLCYGLMSEFDVLLLDEVTVDLDVLVRDDLIRFLKSDSQSRKATILYATHIFDGIDDFPTHIAHIGFGIIQEPLPWPNAGLAVAPGPSSPLYRVALQWLREDRHHRLILEQQGRKTRGARKDETVPSDSETFYKKYDYTH